jgi:hypothetical protein
MDLVLRSSIWLALVLFAIGEYGRRPGRVAPWAWGVWTAGGLTCAFHITWAMGWWHGWSHASAIAETAALTASVVGFPFGGGVYVNYLFVGVWLGEAAWWRIVRDWPTGRPRVMWALRAFYFVIIFSATVVFTSGRARAMGVVLVTALVAIWLAGDLRVQPGRSRGHSDGRGAHRP